MVLDVTATTDQGEKIFGDSKIYMPQSTTSLDNTMVYGPTKKLGIIRDTSIQPFRAKEETFQVKVSKNAKKVNIRVDLSYQPRPGDVYPIHSVRRTLEIDSH